MRHHFLDSSMPFARRAGLLGAAPTAAAQAPVATAPATARLDPHDHNAVVPKVSYSSLFTQCRSLDEDKPISWREASHTMTRIGGWRARRRQAQQPDPTPATKAVEPPPAAPSTDQAKPRPAVLSRRRRRVGNLPDRAVRAQQLRELDAPQTVRDVAPCVGAGLLYGALQQQRQHRDCHVRVDAVWRPVEQGRPRHDGIHRIRRSHRAWCADETARIPHLGLRPSPMSAASSPGLQRVALAGTQQSPRPGT